MYYIVLYSNLVSFIALLLEVNSVSSLKIYLVTVKLISDIPENSRELVNVPVPGNCREFQGSILFSGIPENFLAHFCSNIIPSILENPQECWCKLMRNNFPGIPGNDSREFSENPRIFLEKFRTGNGVEQKLLSRFWPKKIAA